MNTEILRNFDGKIKSPSKVDDGKEWLQDLLLRARKSPTGILSEVVILSPSRASALLSVNPDNRKLSENMIETYATDIDAGRWVFNGEPLIIAETGELNDGQHRCEAVIMAGRSIEVLLVAGISRAARTTIDVGKMRTIGDFAGMSGISDPNVTAAVSNIVQMIEAGLLTESHTTSRRARSFTRAETLSFLRANLPEIKRGMAAINHTHSKQISTVSRICGVLVAVARTSGDWPAAIDFFSSVVNGDGLASTSPAFAVRDRLLTEKNAKTSTIFRTIEILIRGWNAHRMGTRLTRMQLNGSIPRIAL